MTVIDDAVMQYRIGQIEKALESMKNDYEPRIRLLERMSAKVAVWGFLGSTVGGAIMAGIVSYLIK